MDDIIPPNRPQPVMPGIPPRPQPPQQPPVPPPEHIYKPKRSKKGLLLLVVLLIAAAGGAYWYFGVHKKAPVATPQAAIVKKTNTPTVLKLDPAKNYGNKYASGLLPVGDAKYVTDTPKNGSVYACSQYAQNLKSDQGGAGTRGPWFVNNNTQYDINKKVKVQGAVKWTPAFSNQLSGTNRMIVTNDLPSHTTGVFPISVKDPAYLYDKNPNSIKSQTFSYNLAVSPKYGDPQCMGGQSGVMLTGVAIFSGFDAGGRDAGAWEVQDSCSGHPEKSGIYHYHTLSSCITDIGVGTVIGFALDGFPITGPKLSDTNILTTSDLDVCHGISSEITLDNKKVTAYHYVMTQDFPYSVSCFRAEPIQPPGQPATPPAQTH
jgi:hypothetical protein